MRVANVDLAPLQEKYAAILRLRRKEEPDPIAAMRALARRHPGALRELDERTMESLVAREAELAALQRAYLGPAPAALPGWVIAQVLFHGHVRGVLVARRYLRETRAEGGAAPDHFLKWTHDPEARAWASDLQAVARPPRGRLLDLVFSRLAGELAIEVEEARRLVFG